MTTMNPLDYLGQQAAALGAQAVQGAQDSLPALVQAGSQAVQQQIPVLTQAATNAATPAAHQLGKQAGKGAREGISDFDTTELVLLALGGAAAVGLIGLAVHTAMKPAALNVHKGALEEARHSLRRALDWANEKSAELAAAEGELARHKHVWKTTFDDPKLIIGSQAADEKEVELLPGLRAAQLRVKAAQEASRKALKLANDWGRYVEMQLPRATHPIAQHAEGLSDQLRDIMQGPGRFNALGLVYAGRRAALAPPHEAERVKSLLHAADDLGLVSKPKLARIFPDEPGRAARAVPLRTALSWVNAHITAT